MAYVAVKGGQEAIKEAEKLLHYYRIKGGSLPLEIQQIKDQFRLAVDKVMGEGSLYDPDLAALALKQAEGDSIEASFMMRAFRSTLPRNHHSILVDTENMQVIRRISATFKNIPGGQFLGPTTDYSKRMLQFDLTEESEADIQAFLAECLPDTDLVNQTEIPTFPRVIEMLRHQGLVENRKINNAHTIQKEDITRRSIQLPETRPVRLQSMARGETGAMMALAYSTARGYGSVHPTLGELRVGYVPVYIPHPIFEQEKIYIGKVMLTEIEVIAKLRAGRKETEKKEEAKYTIGYGLCFGQNELKAMSMATLDRAMEVDEPSAPAEDEEFVLYHIDGIEASGFVSHWKLPHYVTFQAGLSRLRSIQERRADDDE
ncbi:carbon-phosphorus lyase complex subunit PhnI [Alkalihalobacillus sp. LMS39]|uniref:carbon-phosphorus lyase complex subunit PhnI n=1 Tax=Alkalihalobacillus sp. LMS39 TaxID=2924032 RepID=UPI001FB4D7FC|nr:carbon-phosphorus lyase complex subunit PhnI [Alkalihalobacillus sp. LMS39]UOE95410.1 carbon-phosphorus lyase complex subunit PhnI [Alkalihalobacillus sp. LMS39]